VVPQLTGLHDLHISTITESELLQLEGLQQLTKLHAGVTWPEPPSKTWLMSNRTTSPSFWVSVVELQLPLLL
jgi:hypothetical protein